MMVEAASILSPIGIRMQDQDVRPVRTLHTLANKTIGFLSFLRCNYEPFVEALGALLRGQLDVRETSRRDYRRVVRWSNVWGEVKDWVAPLDGVIVGQGGWGGCVAWCVQATGALQKQGKPAICIVTESFREQAYALAKSFGVAKEQVLVLPADFELWGETGARSYAAEVLPAITERLTRREQQIQGATGAEADTTPASGPGLAENVKDLAGLQALFLQRGWTDGLPIVLPTNEQVQAMMSTLARSPQEVVASLAPLWGAATIEKLAVNAVMAGCRPEYFPVVVAAVEAMADPAFDLLLHATCTSSDTPMFIVNGPMRKALNMNSGHGVFGTAAHPNATIGRALRLIRQNIGGQTVGLTDMTTFGYPGGSSPCIAEDEEHNPWDPLHVQRGFRREDSTVTVTAVVTFQNVCGQRAMELESLLKILGESVFSMGYRAFHADPLGVGNVLIVLAPGYAQRFAAAGYSLHKLQLDILERARFPLEDFPKELLPHVERGGRVKGRYVHMVARPEQLVILVAGGVNAAHGELAIVLHTNHQDWKMITKRIPAVYQPQDATLEVPRPA